jgi:hypothetical protein
MNLLHHILDCLIQPHVWNFFIPTLGCFSGAESKSDQSSTQNSGQTGGANSPSVVSGGTAVTGGAAKTTVVGQSGYLDESTKTSTSIGNNNVINPDSTSLIESALTSLGTALNTATANRDVIVGNSTQPDVQEIGTQTPTTGLVDSLSAFFSSNTLKLILFAAFPVVAGILWLIFRKRKNA